MVGNDSHNNSDSILSQSRSHFPPQAHSRYQPSNASSQRDPHRLTTGPSTQYLDNTVVAEVTSGITSSTAVEWAVQATDTGISEIPVVASVEESISPGLEFGRTRFGGHAYVNEIREAPPSEVPPPVSASHAFQQATRHMRRTATSDAARLGRTLQSIDLDGLPAASTMLFSTSEDDPVMPQGNSIEPLATSATGPGSILSMVPREAVAGATPPAETSGSSLGRKHSLDGNLVPERRVRTQVTSDRSDLRAQLPTPQDSPITADLTLLSEHLESALAKLANCQLTVQASPVIDVSRINMMREACSGDDHFFVLLHHVSPVRCSYRIWRLVVPIQYPRLTGTALLHLDHRIYGCICAFETERNPSASHACPQPRLRAQCLCKWPDHVLGHLKVTETNCP
jgi:hypothetical protein